jgi:Ser/Thr protein kinase RdoA (MazF antagonist)
VWQSVALARQFLPDDVVERFGNGLEATHRSLLDAAILTEPPQKLLRKLDAIENVCVPLCRAHDDLNFRNVFVGEGGSEIILIDFTRAVKRPLSQDVARLDVGLAFDDVSPAYS